MNYRVAGTSATMQDYTVSYSRQRVFPTHIGAFGQGTITFTTVGWAIDSGQNDTAFAVYDQNFQLVNAGNSTVAVNNSTALSFNQGNQGSILSRQYTAGRYYLAVTLGNFNLSSSAALAPPWMTATAASARWTSRARWRTPTAPPPRRTSASAPITGRPSPRGHSAPTQIAW